MEALPRVLRTQPLELDQHRQREGRQHERTDDREAYGGLDDREVHHLAHRRTALVVVDEQVRGDERGVEAERGEGKQHLPAARQVPPAEPEEDHGADRENRRRHPRVELVARRVAGAECYLADRERDGADADVRDPPLRLAKMIDVLQHERSSIRARAHSAYDASSSSSSKLSRRSRCSGPPVLPRRRARCAAGNEDRCAGHRGGHSGDAACRRPRSATPQARRPVRRVPVRRRVASRRRGSTDRRPGRCRSRTRDPRAARENPRESRPATASSTRGSASRRACPARPARSSGRRRCRGGTSRSPRRAAASTRARRRSRGCRGRPTSRSAS